ncbi:hypothetical protein NL676_029282 [Syzygium grande]|nr:hypothetical protein NL676_029282 [Syzygium grande]
MVRALQKRLVSNTITLASKSQLRRLNEYQVKKEKSSPIVFLNASSTTPLPPFTSALSTTTSSTRSVAPSTSLRRSVTPSVTRLAGVRITSDKVKLSDEYGLKVEMVVDLRKPAAKETNQRELKRMGLTG